MSPTHTAGPFVLSDPALVQLGLEEMFAFYPHAAESQSGCDELLGKVLSLFVLFVQHILDTIRSAGLDRRYVFIRGQGLNKFRAHKVPSRRFVVLVTHYARQSLRCYPGCVQAQYSHSEKTPVDALNCPRKLDLYVGACGRSFLASPRSTFST